MDRKYADYAVEQAVELLAIDSPTGFTAMAADWVKARFEALGCAAKITEKGGVLIELGGKDENDALLLEAHTDTLGAMVAEIKSSGRLRLTNLGGLRAENCETENARVYTRSGTVIEGTFQLCNASVHVNGMRLPFGCYNEQAGRRDWGTMRRDGTVKPIHASFSTLTSELGDAKLLGEKRVGDGVRAFVYRKPDGTHTLVYWSESDVDTSRGEVVRLTSECVRAFAFPVTDGGYRFVDMMGTPSVVESRAGSVSLTATRWPSYLTGLPPIGVPRP